MKLEINGNNISYKNNISQKDWQNKLTSKIKEIELLLKNNDLEDKQKTLEIQKNNAYLKLEKIGKELQNMENFLEEENDNQDIDNIDDEESLNKKIYDIRQKNVSLQEQLKMIKGYSNFISKYKTNQIREKNKLNSECDNMKKNIQNNKYISKMTDEEKIILEKNKELKNVNQEIENLLKKIEEKKAQKYIRNIRLKQLKYLSNNKNNPKEKTIMKNNKTESKKKQTLKKKNKQKSQIGEIFDNIILNNKQAYDRKTNNETKNETTFEIIKRRIPFTISSLDNLINDNSNILFKNDKETISQKNLKKNSVISKNKKTSDIIRLEKENISKLIASSENKKNSNLNNQNNNNNIYNINNNKNDVKTKNNDNNIISNTNKDNSNNNNYNSDNPLGWW